MSCVIRSAHPNDLPLLARFNRHLIEDEGSRNPLTLPELETRMKNWLETEQEICLFEEAGTPFGYAIYKVTPDPYFPEIPNAYIRHFFITRERRKEGLGKEALEQLIATRFPASCRVTLEVLESNMGGAHFWQKMGFAPYSTALVRIKEEVKPKS